MGSSQQVSEPERVDLGALGSLTDCGVSQTAENGVGRKAPGLSGKVSSGLGLFFLLSWPVLGCFLGGRQVSVLCARSLGLRNDVMLQQLDSISLRRRETANFLDFADLADLTLTEPEVFRLHYRNHHLTFI